MRGKKKLAYVSKFSQQNCVFYRTDALLKQQISIEYLIKQKAPGALAEKQERAHEEVGSYTKVIVKVKDFFIVRDTMEIRLIN